MKKIVTIFFTVLIASCAAKPMIPGAGRIKIIQDAPDNSCEFLGEVVGSQGNWWTDDSTSTKNKMIGARNEMRNQAFGLGANVLHIMESRNTKSMLSFDVTNVTVIGNAYRCP
ncbi:MAG: DUF4156 domain-containing protein [Porticoccaceae bacterium]